MLQVEINNILSEDEAVARITEIFEKVAVDDESFIITRNDRPMIGIVNIEQLEGEGISQPATQTAAPTMDSPEYTPAQPIPSIPEEPELPDFPDIPTSTSTQAPPLTQDPISAPTSYPTPNLATPQGVDNSYPVSGSPLDDDLPDLDQPTPISQAEAAPPINSAAQMAPIKPVTPPAPTTPSPLTQKELPDYPEVPDMPV
jgi:hypothetical protein